jgi:hypothetical protein
MVIWRCTLSLSALFIQQVKPLLNGVIWKTLESILRTDVLV